VRTKSVSDLARSVDRYLKKNGISSPGSRLLGGLFDAIYFASLKTEEGKPLQLRAVLLNPKNPDPHKPPHPRPHRWKVVRLETRIPLTVPHLVKLSKAADPWTSCLAVYFDSSGSFFIWGLLDQTVHFNTMLVRETESGYAPPGIIHVVITGTADITVYREASFIARLAQDSLLKSQVDVFSSGQVRGKLSSGITAYLDAVLKSLGAEPPEDWDYLWAEALADQWIRTLCRLLISIQRYRHGGALLITTDATDLEVKYRLNYNRLPRALINLGHSMIKSRAAREEVIEKYLNRDRHNLPVKLYLDEQIAYSNCRDFEDETTGCIRFISALSCVDGLILSTPDLSIKGFGVEIRTKKDVVAACLSARPTLRKKSIRQIEPSHYGTRHRSMMRYCMAHPGSIGFVISQDGDIRAVTRVESSLVLWENLQVHWPSEARLGAFRLKKK
jgi:hypothetical protein